MLRKLSFAFLLTAAPLSAQQVSLTPGEIARIDSIFAAWSPLDGPGCQLGVSRHDTVVLERAWGSANLEHAIPITTSTIFEAGSVSKQFTAAAVLRLAQQGKLSLDDDIRKYVPEVPVYDAPITIRHLLHHTSGLRDWGTVMSFAGWPRGSRTYTHGHVLDIVARQRSLNYPVGTEYLYSNTNYNLLAIIAERVSGKSLADFTRAEIFEPLGMTHTGWRDNYATIVPGRAQAYSGRAKNWRLDMPFENIYGNSSLLTTVGDLLKWNANAATRKVGGAQLISMQETKGKLKSGREIEYAAGVGIGEFRGTPAVTHSGATAGYRAYLARYPEKGYGVAVLCNAGNANPALLAQRVMSIVIPGLSVAAASPRDTVGIALDAARAAPLTGYYRHALTDEPAHVVFAGGRVVVTGRGNLVAITDRQFTTATGRTHFVFETAAGGPARIKTWSDGGDTTYYVSAGAPLPAASFSEYAGDFYSAEADGRVSLSVEGGKLVLSQRPDTRGEMQPIYRDGFTVLGTYVKFTRGSDGKVDGLLATSERARNVRFDKVK